MSLVPQVRILPGAPSEQRRCKSTQDSRNRAGKDTRPMSDPNTPANIEADALALIVARTHQLNLDLPIQAVCTPWPPPDTATLAIVYSHMEPSTRQVECSTELLVCLASPRDDIAVPADPPRTVSNKVLKKVSDGRGWLLLITRTTNRKVETCTGISTTSPSMISTPCFA